MIAIFMLLKLLLDFSTNYGLLKRRFRRNSIESCRDYNESRTGSSIVFSNCEKVLFFEEIDESELSVEKGSGHKFCPKCHIKLKISHPRLNTIKKMDCEEDSPKDALHDIMSGLKGNLTSAADCNSNNVTMKEGLFLSSNDSIQDFHNFLQDNSDYQWFLDYGCKYNNCSHHQSILSLTKSDDLSYYDDMARNIDANLAEVDMDDFNREDIHSVLSSLPNIQGAEEREMFASVTGSMMVKFDFDLSSSRRSNSQEEQFNNSICKSKLLFSPVKESYLPSSNLSIDSLDLSENDINLMVTCQSNKNNYTIAFEGSTVMTSEDSKDRDICNSAYSGSGNSKNTQYDLLVENFEQTENERSKPLNHVPTSDSTFTTWSKIKEHPHENILLKKDPSRNNTSTVDISHKSGRDISCNSCRSLSLPDLFEPKKKQNLNMSLSVKLNNELKSSLINEGRCVKLYDIQINSKNMDHSTSSSSGKLAHSFSLVKLFIKQKSASHEGMANFIADQTDVSDENCKNNKLNLGIEQSHEKNSVNEKINNTNKLVADNCFLKNCQNTLLIREVNGKEKLKKQLSKPEGQICSNSLYEHLGLRDKKQKVQSRNGYCSDESIQENGSNTESAENITCNSTKASSVAGNKKFLIEKSMQTSKVFDGNENTQKNLLKVPVYILYPNYSLPNLEFLTKEHYIQNIDFSKVFLKPQKFKTSESQTSSNDNKKSLPKRPFSVNDIETLKKTGFKHVRDWDSLTFLLPKEYKEFLQEIPEIVAQLKDVKNSKQQLVPLFCLSPPPSRRIRKRPNSCDVNISNDYRSSNFSSTATQPSSGYRGSSTMLNSNQSTNTSSPRNPSFSYKYDTNAESGSSRRSGSLSHNKNYYCNSEDSNESTPSRPPLPKGILRNNSLDNQQYTCKTQKEYANKRYSMVELTDKNVNLQEKGSKRRTVHNSPKSPQAFIGRIDEQKQLDSTAEIGSSRPLKILEPSKTIAGSNLEKDLRKLEELLEISAVFGESVESFSENDMVRLRSQVSKFLTMQKNLEKVSETLETDKGKTREVADDSDGNAYEEGFSLAMKNLHTPHNTPEHKRQQINNSNNNNNINKNNNNNNNDDLHSSFTGVYKTPCSCQIHELEEEDCNVGEDNLGGLKKTVSFAEKISFAVKELELSKEKTASSSVLSSQKNNQAKPKRPVDLPICEELFEDSSAIVSQNSADLHHKRDLVLDVKIAIKKILKLCKETSDDPANICLHHLCPSLYAVLSDGLKEEIETPFGPIRNSVWSVIEASSQQGPMTQTLNELVQRLNRDDIFTEGLIKFNAFIFGLLNARALSGWFSYLRTRDSLLRKYYENSGLLLLSNTSGASVRVLIDQLITILEPLSSLQFNLDLMYQTKLLHCSLQNLNCLLEEPSNSDFLTPTKQFMLLKLVQSIQNSISQSGEGKRNKHILDDIEEKTSDPPVSHLLEKNKNVITRPGRSRTRPRSGLDTAGIDHEGSDVASTMKKRWSVVNLNSKLVEAFDKLLDYYQSDCEENQDIPSQCAEEELATPKKKVLKAKVTNAVVDDSEADLYTKAQKKHILLNLNKKGSGKNKNYKTELDGKESFDSCETQTQRCDQKFKWLQQKWERLNEKSQVNSDAKSKLEKTPSLKVKLKTPSVKSHKSEKSSNDTTTPSPTSRISKIPRLVTSPVSSTPIIRQTGNVQKVLSPPAAGDSNQKIGKIVNDSIQKGSTVEGNATPIRANSRTSRFDEKNGPGLGTNAGKNYSISPTGGPPRNYYNTKKNESVFKRVSPASLNRKPSSKLSTPRIVRTLTHRLPSDSGHLSFNEGEKLKVVLDVDKAWLLCCRGSQKGLVPKSLVISDLEDKF